MSFAEDAFELLRDAIGTAVLDILYALDRLYHRLQGHILISVVPFGCTNEDNVYLAWATDVYSDVYGWHFDDYRGVRFDLDAKDEITITGA